MNPIFIRELKQLSRLKRTVVLLVMYNLLIYVTWVFAYYITFGTQNSAGYLSIFNWIRRGTLIMTYCIYI